MQTDLSRAVWRKSTYSNGSGGNCCEWSRLTNGSVGLRDSKLGDDSPTLVITTGGWKTFIGGIKTGRFN